MIGGRSRARTCDPLIKSQLVFETNQQLSKPKAVKPTSNGQWLSSDLSNQRVLSRAREISRRRCNVCLLSALALLTVGACTPRYSTADWSEYVSKHQTLQFIAAASCGTPSPFNPVGDDAAFFKVSSLQPVAGQSWQYDVVYLTDEGWRRGRFDIKQWWSASQNRSAPASAWRQNKNCAVLAEIPRSKDSARPYHIEPAAAKEAEYKSLTGRVVLVLSLVFAVFTLALIPSWWGYEQSERWAIKAVAAVGILFVSVATAAIFLRLPWDTFQTALGYYKFFDELPRNVSGNLLPIAPQQLYFLIAGPLHPNDMQFAFTPFALVTGVLGTLWLIFVAPSVVRGLYWLTTPLPLQDVHRQALRDGRAPTAPEIMAAVLKANVGKSAWQLNIMRRKADAFARNLSDIARHI